MEKIKWFLKGNKKFLTIPVAGLLGLFFLPITILLLIGWFVYAKVGSEKIKFAGLSLVGLLILFFGAAYISALTNPTPPKPSQEVKSEATQTLSTPSSTPSQNPENLVKVTRVIDGDTIEIEGGQRVRYIGIDTPERDACFSSESTAKNKELVDGRAINLEKDVSETDRYGRLLRYVYVGDTLVNEVLVKEGYAQVYTYPPDVKYNERFLAAEKEARDNTRGLWTACQATPITTSTPVYTPKPFSPTPKPSTSSQTPGGSCKYSCSSPDRDCSDFSTHTEAQEFFQCCGFTASYDPMKLDSTGIGDGIACESLP